MTVYRRNK